MKRFEKKRNVLISVFDKSNLLIFCQNLKKRNFNIYATSGTFKVIKKFGIEVISIEEYINFPEIMNNRIKTLHPKIHGGILANRRRDINVLEQYNIILFDLVVINFNCFYESFYESDRDIKEKISAIDIGGPAMVRAAAKNYEYVSIVVDVKDYEKVIKELDSNNGKISLEKKVKLASKAFRYTAEYESSISSYFDNIIIENKNKYSNSFVNNVVLNLKKVEDLCYGENPDQQAALYSSSRLLCNFRKKNIYSGNKQKLSYNNIYDSDVALDIVNSFLQPACAIIKHGNPCGVALGCSSFDSYSKAYECDTISSYGGVVAFNCLLEEKTVEKIIKSLFVEVILAPKITCLAKKMLLQKSNILVFIYPNDVIDKNTLDIRSVNYGVLIQEKKKCNSSKKWRIVTKKKPNKQEMEDVKFSWKVVQFIKSNAIVFVKNLYTVGIGSGQTSRIGAVKIASNKVREKGIRSIVMASDGFFPFVDGVELSISLGVTCIVQPGGSIRDQEVIELANKNKVSMIFTDNRCFKH